MPVRLFIQKVVCFWRFVCTHWNGSQTDNWLSSEWNGIREKKRQNKLTTIRNNVKTIKRKMYNKAVSVCWCAALLCIICINIINKILRVNCPGSGVFEMFGISLKCFSDNPMPSDEIIYMRNLSIDRITNEISFSLSFVAFLSSRFDFFFLILLCFFPTRFVFNTADKNINISCGGPVKSNFSQKFRSTYRIITITRSFSIFYGYLSVFPFFPLFFCISF